MASTIMREGAMPARGRTLIRVASLLAALRAATCCDVAAADESGLSYWLQGQFGSFAAVPSEPGWSFDNIYYHATAATSGGRRIARGGRIHGGLTSPSDLFMFTPTYTFATPVLGGQAAVAITATYGRNTSSASETLPRLGEPPLLEGRSDSVVGFGDLDPYASLKWNLGVSNFMVYATAGVPVGAYDPNLLSSIGIGHWAADAGAGYTYYDEQVGFEASAVLGFTYNFVNPYTQYQSGIDAHLDWAVSPYASEKMHVGAVGYVYRQVTGDSGPGTRLGEFKSRVLGIGPQIGFFFPFADRQGYLNLKAYQEYNAENRLEGWTAYITFSVEPPETKSAKSAGKQ
ncbi:MAG TPA: transporter [Xanthobacteraceae bacterium]